MNKDVYLGNGCFGSGQSLKHYKYISRKRVGGKWVYEYADDKSAAPSTVPPKARVNPNNDLQVNRKLGNQIRVEERAKEAQRLEDKKERVANIKSVNPMKTTGMTDADGATAKRINQTKLNNQNAQVNRKMDIHTKAAERPSVKKAANTQNQNAQVNRKPDIHTKAEERAKSKAKANAYNQNAQVDRKPDIHTKAAEQTKYTTSKKLSIDDFLKRIKKDFRKRMKR